MTAFEVIVIIMLILSNLNTFLIASALFVINANTRWGRGIEPVMIKGGAEDGENQES